MVDLLTNFLKVSYNFDKNSLNSDDELTKYFEQLEYEVKKYTQDSNYQLIDKNYFMYNFDVRFVEYECSLLPNIKTYIINNLTKHVQNNTLIHRKYSVLEKKRIKWEKNLLSYQNNIACCNVKCKIRGEYNCRDCMVIWGMEQKLNKIKKSIKNLRENTNLLNLENFLDICESNYSIDVIVNRIASIIKKKHIIYKISLENEYIKNIKDIKNISFCLNPSDDLTINLEDIYESLLMEKAKLSFYKTLSTVS